MLMESEVLTPLALTGRYDRLLARVSGLHEDEAAWNTLFEDWNALKALVSGERSRGHYRYAQDTADEAAQAAFRELREEWIPVAESSDSALRQLFLTSPVRSELESRHGSLLFTYFAQRQEHFDPENVSLEVQKGEVVAAYDRLMGQARIPVSGQVLTLSQTNARLADPRPTLREEAWRALGEWLLDHHTALHDLYGHVVRLGQRQAANLGHVSYVPLAYARLKRTDYGPEQARIFREGIKRHVVPALARIRAWQAHQLGTDKVNPWDVEFFPGLSLPTDCVPLSKQLDAAARVFAALSGRLASHFDRMRVEGLIDLENRPGKQPGAFCTTYDDEGKVAIFCNGTGAASDVRTLLHEMGHAFQGWESGWIVPVDLRWPTFDACEVHSMGMEFLALPEIEAFFNAEDAKRYRKLQLIQAVTFLPYAALVDEFQHWIHEHPEATSQARDAAWLALRAQYLVGERVEGFEDLLATRWKRQPHLFHTPFYYLDYAIALSGALALWQRDRVDHEQALASYLELCRLGGTQSLLGLFAQAGLPDPFAPDRFAPLVADLMAQLAI